MNYMEEFTVDTLYEQKYKLRRDRTKQIQQLNLINKIEKEFETWEERNKYAKKSLITLLDEYKLLFPIYPEWMKVYIPIMYHYGPKPGYDEGDYYHYPSPPPTPHLSLAYSYNKRAELFRDQIRMAYDLGGINVLPIESSIMEIPLNRWVE